MGYRRGYQSELRAKKELEEIYGKGNVIKVAISQQGADHIVVSCGELVKIIEVKETKKNKYYPSQKEKNQFRRIIEFARQHRIPAELWIYFKKGTGKPVIKQTQDLY